MKCGSNKYIGSYRFQWDWECYSYFSLANSKSGSDLKLCVPAGVVGDEEILVAGEVKHSPTKTPGEFGACLLAARRQVITTTSDLWDSISVLGGKQPMFIASNHKVFLGMMGTFIGINHPMYRLVMLYSEDPSEYFEGSPSNFLGDPSDVIRFTPDDPKPHTLIKLLSGEF